MSFSDSGETGSGAFLDGGEGAGAGAGVDGNEPDSSFGYGLVYNPMDPYNMYPHHETGEEIYGPPPMFGYNKFDPLNMKPFNPNVFGGLFGSSAVPAAAPAPAVAPTPVPQATLGPNPFTPLLQPLTPVAPLAPPQIPVAAQPMVHQPMNPVMLAALATAANGDSSASLGQDPSSSYYLPAPYYDPLFGVQYVSPQNLHPTDPNNQYPHPLTGSMTEPGPALAGGYNAFDPHNIIGAPTAASDRERVMEHNRAAMQAQSPYAPYHMPQLPVPPS